MVAYSFKKQFVEPIRVGLGIVPAFNVTPKRHTIRADRKRHARPGEELQLYRGMRTKQCFLIGKGRCTGVHPIELVFRGPRRGVWIAGNRIAASAKSRDAFARADGFDNWASLAAFWKENHGDPPSWKGIIINWEPLS